ncbi:MAG: nicotinate (nicotinamide) nucleotide adenylyltransferase [Erysipelotrichaceae bacterium]|nr:nicotinate (nicotinamide) nucleotide adenylyltransferase [Erysipelotrichaceae bacterium]
MKIAVLGGSFDPIHEGHLQMAKQVLQRKLADEVWFMPAGRNPLKDRVVSDYEIRCKMVLSAIKPYRKMRCSTLESELPVPSYTITTVKELKKRYPEHDFYWIIGEDQAVQLDKWKDIDELKSLIRFIVFERADSDSSHNDDFIWIKDFNCPASSTKVRQGEFQWISKGVLHIVLEEGLYFDEILRHHVSKYRYEHSVAVAETAMHLARVHHVDVMKAYIASMMHDVCKEMDKQQMKQWMSVCFPEYMDMPEPVWHGWLAYEKLKRMGIYDKEICSAVYHHVLGDGKGTLDKIIYVADKSNPKRKHDITEEIKTAEKDLSAAMELIQINYQKRKAARDE